MAFPIQTISTNFPDDLKGLFVAYGEEATQCWEGIDYLGRHRVAIGYGDEFYRYAVHKDTTGMIWNIFIDEDERKEIPFINVRTKDGHITRYHPETFKSLGLESLRPSDCILYPPKDLPLMFKFMAEPDDMFIEGKSDLLEKEELTKENKNDNPYDTHDKVAEDSVEFSEQNNSKWPLFLFGGFTTALGITGSIYIIRTLNTCVRYLYRKDIWSSWHSEEPYDFILQLKPSSIADQLVKDINTFYYQKENPIELFLQDIQGEAEILMQWIQFRNNVQRLLLPVNPELEELEYRLEVLNLMRKAVHCWRAQRWQSEQASE